MIDDDDESRIRGWCCSWVEEITDRNDDGNDGNDGNDNVYLLVKVGDR